MEKLSIVFLEAVENCLQNNAVLDKITIITTGLHFGLADNKRYIKSLILASQYQSHSDSRWLPIVFAKCNVVELR